MKYFTSMPTLIILAVAIPLFTHQLDLDTQFHNEFERKWNEIGEKYSKTHYSMMAINGDEIYASDVLDSTQYYCKVNIVSINDCIPFIYVELNDGSMKMFNVIDDEGKEQ